MFNIKKIQSFFKKQYKKINKEKLNNCVFNIKNNNLFIEKFITNYNYYINFDKIKKDINKETIYFEYFDNINIKNNTNEEKYDNKILWNELKQKLVILETKGKIIGKIKNCYFDYNGKIKYYEITNGKIIYSNIINIIGKDVIFIQKELYLNIGKLKAVKNLLSFNEIISKRLKKVNLKSLLENKIPEELLSIIKEKDGRYESQKENYPSHTYNLTDRQRIYLGTYFPRSFMEGYLVGDTLLKNGIYKKDITPKNELNIIDFGSGEGGFSLGFIWRLYVERIFGLKINIYLVDVDEKALNIGEEFFAKLFDLSIKKKHIKIEENNYSIKLIEIFKTIKDNFDIIIASKFINELNDKRLYSVFLTTVRQFLKSKGIIIINEIANYGTDNGISGQEIIEEINKNVIYKNILKRILPLSCALYENKCIDKTKRCYQLKNVKIYNELKNNGKTDKSKIFFMVFCKKDFFDILKEGYKIYFEKYSDAYYKISEREYCYCHDGKLFRQEDIDNHQIIIDAFTGERL